MTQKLVPPKMRVPLLHKLHFWEETFLNLQMLLT